MKPIKQFTILVAAAFTFNSWGQTQGYPAQQQAPLAPPPANQGVVIQNGPNGQEPLIEGQRFAPPLKPVYIRDYFSFHVAPEYIYNDSESDFWHRDYSTESPGYSVGFRFWFLENFGLNLDYRTSVMASVLDTSDGFRREQVDHMWLDWGLSYRVFADGSENSAYFRGALTHRTYELKAPTSSQGRPDLKTDGLLIEFEGGIPLGDYSQFVLSAEIAPSLDHEESRNTFTGRSGKSPDTFGVGLGLAYEYRLIWNSKFRVSYSYFEETNQFSGQSTIVDPVKGSKLTNVHVKNKFRVVQLAYILGF